MLFIFFLPLALLIGTLVVFKGLTSVSGSVIGGKDERRTYVPACY